MAYKLFDIDRAAEELNISKKKLNQYVADYNKTDYGDLEVVSKYVSGNEFLNVCSECPIGIKSKELAEDCNINYILEYKLSKSTKKYVIDKMLDEIRDKIIFDIIGDEKL
ncbi:hypothetical protein U729_3173 (plasmid) [Clostridium baratii str. Sullivan]|uniref:Uncharacterized protein n=1 Tax=Clostridium baratii str. Sullivan TaxID=1415775 RepID=A0A0A7G315_9CLOT|nr:hypothetical protein [Clostridium baratii]AIY85371.1 hypothetical protein U729_3173 [Clostridium baratii str. Sullivan]